MIRSLSLALITFATYTNVKAEKLPPILDYFPNCEQSKSETIEVESSISLKKGKAQSSSQEYAVKESELDEETTILLKTLQTKASAKDANALVLTHRILLDNPSRKSNGVLLKFRAQLISNCSDLTPNTDAPAPVNSLGKRIMGNYNFKRDMVVQTTIDLSKNLHFPQVTEHTVSIKDGVYGVNLGDSVDKVKKALGDPSVELYILESEIVLGYGRKHWFYFQEGKLAKVDTEAFGLEATLLNEIPLRDFFDDQKWKIDGIYQNKAPSRTIQLDLGLTKQKVQDQTLKISNATSNFTYRFFAKADPYSGAKTYFLSGFTLQKIAYKPKPHMSFSGAKRQFEIINEVKERINNGQKINAPALLKSLGEYAAVINIDNKEKIVVFNPQLAIRVNGDRIERISFSDDFIDMRSSPNIKATPWEFGGLKFGQTVQQAKKEMGADGFDLNGSIEFESDYYQVELNYETKEDRKVLYAMNIYIF